MGNNILKWRGITISQNDNDFINKQWGLLMKDNKTDKEAEKLIIKLLEFRKEHKNKKFNKLIWKGHQLLTVDEMKYAKCEFNKACEEDKLNSKEAEKRVMSSINRMRKEQAKKEKDAEREAEKQRKDAEREAKLKEREAEKQRKDAEKAQREAEKQQLKAEKNKSINCRILYFEGLGLEVDSNGNPCQNAGNYKALLNNKKQVPHTFKWNEFSESIEMDGRPIKDNDITLLYNQFSNIAGFENDKKLKAAITETALDNSYHPVKQYLESLVWDGTPRVETMFHDFLSADDTELYRAYAKLFMLAAIKRVYKPGCKFDNMLVLQGEQGNGKSTFCEKLAVNDKWYNDNISIADRDKDSLLYMQDAWIVIMDELDAWNRADTNAAKGFMSKRTDKFRAPYATITEEHPRHCVFIGNTNDETFLKDSTAITERRYWVVKTKGNWQTSKDKIKSMTPEVINQLWAEAKYMYDQNPDVELMIPSNLYEKMITDQLQFKNEYDCEQFTYLETILNKKYTDAIYDYPYSLYNEFEGKTLDTDTNETYTLKDKFTIESLTYLFDKERWFRKKNTFTQFAKWTNTPAWSGSKWIYKKAKVNGIAKMCLVRINEFSEYNETNTTNNQLIKYTKENKYVDEKLNNDDSVIKISGNKLFM